ncbi:hypothetical protein Tco_0897494 [Tanacetum coccineum]
MILELVEHDPLIWPTIEENGVTRTKKYIELSATEKIQADCDLKATNIILQGLPSDIYSLVNHHRVAKDLWERIQLLMQGIKVLLVEAQRNGKVLNEEELEFLADTKAVFTANLSTYGLDVLYEEKEAKNIDTEIALEKKVKELDNIVCKIAELQAKDTTIEKLKANIKRLNKTSTKNSVKNDIDEIETINIELEHRVTKLIAENEHLKQTYKQLYDSIKPSRVQAKEHAESLVNQLNQKSVEITDLNAQLQEKVFVITALKNDLRKFKGKDIVDNAAQASNATTIAPGMYKLDPVTLAPKDKNNRETHIYYLKHTMEQAAILREIVEQSKSLNPLDSASYSACKYVKLIQELLGYVRETCPDIHKPNEKLVVVTPINKKKTVKFAEPVISSSTSQKHSMFDARHELCFLEFVSDMNASSKSKSVKKAKKKEEWKPTRKVFTKIGYNWRPTGRTFTLVGNECPLTRITATNKMPLREPIPIEVIAQESVVTKVYTRRPKVPKTTGSYNKPEIAKSAISNKTEPGTSRGSNTSVALSSSSVDLRLSKFSCGIWTPDAPST